MKNTLSADLQLHNHLLLKRGRESLTTLIEKYSEHLLSFLNRCYRKHLSDKMYYASEAVYNTLEWYHEHPRMYDPQQGSLRKFLELKADRELQSIFTKENYNIHISGIDHVLARNFDNERDVRIAKLLLRNDYELSSYIEFADTGILRFSQVKAEVARQQNRVKNVLRNLQMLKPARTERTAGLILALGEPTSYPNAYRKTGL